MPLKPFQEFATCPKCGNTDIKTRFYNGRRTDGWPVSCGCHAKPPMRGFFADYVEHIERQCQNCRYTWPEAPLDMAGGTDER
jgi:hypothetical protein